MSVPGDRLPAPVNPKTNALSIVALVTGLVCCGTPLGLIFGLISLSQIKSSGEQGKGMAITGVVLGAIGLVITLLYVVLVVWLGVLAGVGTTTY